MKIKQGLSKIAEHETCPYILLQVKLRIIYDFAAGKQTQNLEKTG